MGTGPADPVLGPDGSGGDGSAATGPEDGGLGGTFAGGLAEATVVGRAQDGDLVAFEMLLRRYQPPLLRLARQILHDRGEAEDAVQDAMVQVWRTLPTLNRPGAFRAWIYQLTTHRCLDRLRRSSRRRTEPTATDRIESDQVRAGTGADPTRGPAQRAEHTAQLRSLQAGLATLPPRQRTCWVLRELHEFSYAEIATTMQLPISTVRGQIARARDNLMTQMEPWR